MNFTERRHQLRAVLASHECIRPAPVFDPLSAWMAESLGFKTAFMPGPVAQAVLLGAPNHHYSVMTLSELAAHVGHICKATGGISLVAGARDGFGNAFNVIRTVQELESAGLACLTIDDLLEPAPFGAKIKGHVGHLSSMEDQLISLEETIGRIKAASEARQDSSLVIGVRSSAIPVGGVS